MKKDSVDLFTDGNVVAGRLLFKDGKVVAEGPSWIHALLDKPHGGVRRFLAKKLMTASAGRDFLAAVVEQYDGSGIRARWTP